MKTKVGMMVRMPHGELTLSTEVDSLDKFKEALQEWTQGYIKWVFETMPPEQEPGPEPQ